jgi:hypothetical protein
MDWVIPPPPLPEAEINVSDPAWHLIQRSALYSRFFRISFRSIGEFYLG